MERIVYNLGQIKSKGVLDARDARDFANAGLAIVPKLAEMYSNMNGKMVTTADVYEMMTKKMVSYGDVMKVINGLTDEGGMFFDFQAKQAQTLKGQLSNLVDAWNMMLNQIGESEQGVMKGSVSLARELFTNWRTVVHVIEELVIAFGRYGAAQLVINATIGKENAFIRTQIMLERNARIAAIEKLGATRSLTQVEISRLALLKITNNANYVKLLTKKNLTKAQALWMAAMNGGNTKLLASLNFMGLLSKEEIRSVTGLNSLSTAWRFFSASAKSALASIYLMLPALAAMAAIGSLVEWWSQASERSQQMADLNKSIADQAKGTVDDINKYLKDNQPTIQIVEKGTMGNAESLKLWDNLREEIEKTSASAEYFVAKLLAIQDVQKRNDAAINYLKTIRDTADAMKGIADQDIITTDNGPWGIAGEGLISDLKDFGREFKTYKDIANQMTNTSIADFWDVPALKNSRIEAESEIDKSARLIEKTLNEQGIFIDTNRDKFVEGLGQIKQQILKAHPEIQGAMLDLFNQRLDFNFGSHEAAWDKFMQVLKNTSANSFSDMTSDALDKWTGYNAKSNDKMDQGIKSALEIIRKSSPEFYSEVYKIIQNAPDFKLRIGISFGVNQLADLQKDYMDRVQAQIGMVSKDYNKLLQYKPSGNEDLSAWSKEQQQAIKKNTEEINVRSKKITPIAQKEITDLKEENRLRIESLKLFGLNAESDKDLTKEQNKGNASQKKALSEEAQAIKNEIDLIDKLSSNYDKLTTAGMSSTDAISLLNGEYKNSIGSINSVLGKYKLPKFNIEDFAGKDISGQLAYLEKLRDTMKAKGLEKLKPDAYKEVSLQIEKITVDAKTYDLSRITDGLQEQLNNIKESYELGIEIEQNPELGELFTNIFKIDPNSIIRTAEDAINALQNVWSEKVKAYNELNPSTQINVTDILSTKPTDLAKTLGLQNSSEIIQQYKAFYDYAKKIREDDYKNTVKSWNDILSKYSEIEYKKIGIQKTAAKERLTVIQKFGEAEEYKQALNLNNQIQISDDPKIIKDLQDKLSNIIDKISKRNPVAIPITTAITEKSNRETAAIDFEQFKNSDLYIKAFEDLSRVGNATLDALYQNLLKFSQDPNLDFAQLREIMRQMKSVRDQIGANDPFKQVTNGLKKWKTAQNDLNLAKESGDIKLISDAENRLKEAQDDVTKGLGSIKKGFEVFASLGNSAISIIKDLAEGFGITFGEDTQRILDNIGKALGIVSAALGILVVAEEAAAIAGTTLMATLWPLLAVTAALTVAFSIFGNKNAKIDKGIKASEVNVKKLENAYKSLDRAITQAIGDAEIGAKKAAIANKELQLVELQRQLSLEKSRSGKKRDESKIADLKGQIIDLKNSITDLTNSIVTDMLGISSAKDAAESLVSSMIEAFRNGEDYMKQYTESFDKMIDNMIMKAIVSKVIGDKIEELMNTLQKKADERASKYSSDLASATAASQETDEQIAQGLRNAERKRVFDELYVPDENDSERDENNRQYAQAQADAAAKKLKITKEDIDNQRKIYEDYLKKVQGQISTATAITPDDVSEVTGDIKNWKDGVKMTFEEYMKAFGITYGQDATSDLSGLQQGIQNITETQAGAIEAYMNGISGQVYLHTSLLQSLLNNSNVSMGLQSQMLLQMQQGYQVQTSIQSMLNGWYSNNGRSVRVEMA